MKTHHFWLLAATALALHGCSKTPPPAPVAEVPCLIWGDSIASLRGLGEHFPDCLDVAQVGLPSADIRKLVPAGLRVKARFAVISAGSNPSPALADDLAALRAVVDGPVIWIVPAHTIPGGDVRSFADGRGDAAVGFQAGRDGVHPASYAALAQAVAHTLKAKGIEP